MTKLILASQSPRRAQLLTQIGVSYEICNISCDETPIEGERPEALVNRLAKEKAQTAWNTFGNEDDQACVYLGADTLGELDGQWLLKPTDKADYIRMMECLSGRTHKIHSSVALVGKNAAGQEVNLQCHSLSEVTFRQLTQQDINIYWETGEPVDKAGGYAIQGLASIFVEKIKGSYSGIVGLPLCETARMLREAGILIWNEQLA